MKTCEAEIQSGKWENAYKIIGLYFVVLHHCISTDLTKAYQHIANTQRNTRNKPVHLEEHRK